MKLGISGSRSGEDIDVVLLLRRRRRRYLDASQYRKVLSEYYRSSFY
jgi:hypothetical protein